MAETPEREASPPVDLGRHLAARLGPLAFFLFIVVTVAAPLAYMVMGVYSISIRAEASAELVADLIEEEAQQRPILWRYDASKLVRHLNLQAAHQSIVRVELTDQDGHLLDLGLPPAKTDDIDLLWYSAPIGPHGESGQVWVGVTPVEVERQALLLLLGFAALGAVLAGVMYGLPLKAILEAETQIAGSRAALEHLNATLEAQVVERSSQLSEALDEVRDKEQRLRELSGRAVALQEAERRSLSRELHDSAGQALTAVRINLQLLAAMVEAGKPAHALAERTAALVDSTLEEIRRVVDALAPAVLDDLGLRKAVERHCDDFSERTGVSIEVVIEGLDLAGVDTGVETAAYRIVQESLTNVARHANASHVDIRLRRVDVGESSDRVVITIRDDGDGFDPEEVRRKRRRGLRGMHERVELLGGSIQVESAPGEGAKIAVDLPVKAEESEEGEDEH
ncbi:Response regulator receiver:ATP-binding region, ATPase-like:Histidine kinase, dimerization and [Plesiocystis pacifica SIR-1]|uniref:histidine kinase n=1 Tax=Plesiocystis pacifica SIR-1 TaxID=391625 RepID=A6G6J8_9BACT|nr:sensor histidine kinase [Plesiocystis pacifica]EDM78475.1 Response regulator receiver:ATP-binding region, ATPase-like:Histidine kinase, dimerization and [Plesiocystis pacifica SIR-1]